ncbi:hypothetical protein NU08_2588 [Flavobacterium anhuiense]|uniref:Uncharacterized protein n=1 Tax=Flavobacterium anhuiense TaxID=459526 RepID=A0A444VXF4_9FLAO|nr:hypothetical protein NU08_2588 [Flavobacterium anhuiense]
MAIDYGATCGDFSFVEMTKMRAKHHKYRKKFAEVRGICSKKIASPYQKNL